MRIPLSSSTPDQLVQAWNRAFAPFWSLDPQDLWLRTAGSELLIEEASWYDGDGRFVAVKSPSTAYPGAPTDRCHLAACVGMEDRLDEVFETCAAMGYQSLVFGMDHDHIWPGFPEDDGRYALMMAAGFQVGGRHCDLERDLAGFEAPEPCQELLARHQATVHTAAPQDAEAIDRFLARSFPGRWRHDTIRKITIDKEPGDIVLLRLADDIQGFAFTQREGVRRPIGGAVWKRSLGPAWGALGPIGIAEQARGKGLGDALLASALQILAERGSRQTIIDWTTLEGFYGRHGFVPTRRYVTLTKGLTP